MTSNYDGIMNRRRGSSTQSWMSNKSINIFNFGAITPLNINPPSINTPNPSQSQSQFVIDSTCNTNNASLPKSAINPSSLSTVSSIDTAMLNDNTQDFVRSAPAPNQNDINTWDQAINAWKTPTSMDMQNATMDLDTNLFDEEKIEMPEFMKSSFYTNDDPGFSFSMITKRSSIESMASLNDPNQPAPQSAPPSLVPTAFTLSLKNFSLSSLNIFPFFSSTNSSISGI